MRVEFAGAWYHVTARGNERRTIFRSDRDRERFITEPATMDGGDVMQIGKTLFVGQTARTNFSAIAQLGQLCRTREFAGLNLSDDQLSQAGRPVTGLSFVGTAF